MLEAFTLAVTIAATLWGAYKWLVTRPKERAELELMKQELELEKEVPYLEFQFTVDVHHQTEQTALLVQVHATNRGKRLAACKVSHRELLTVAKVTTVENGEMRLDKHRDTPGTLCLRTERLNSGPKLPSFPARQRPFPLPYPLIRQEYTTCSSNCI